MKTVIIGGVAGGATAAARLRRLDENAEIIMVERGEYISFANCGLPYYIGGAITNKQELTLQSPQSFYQRFNVDVRVFSEAVAIDTALKQVTIHDLVKNRKYNESYDKLILSMGAAPILPPIPGIDSEKVFTLRNIPDTLKIKNFIDAAPKDKPLQVAVVGGGYIGVEMAENLKHAGCDVTIIELADHLIAPLDFDMAADVHNHLHSKGIQLILNNGVQSIIDTGDALTIALQQGSMTVDMLIMSVGVKPETELAKQAGIAVDQRGSIIVDKQMRTSAADVWAVGDAVAPFVPLAGPANKQGRIAADNICGIKSQYGGTQGSAILKIFDMTVATTGINENKAKAEGIDYEKVFLFSPSHAGYYPGGRNMSIKVVYERQSGKLLGAQLVGYDGVDKRCDVLATAIRLGATAADLTTLELCYAPPFGSAKDPVNMAGYVIENIMSGRIKQFHWHDVDQLPRDGSVTLLDVRTLDEMRRGAIDGFIHIPLHELRQHIGQLDKSKPIYVHCFSGMRSYIACCLLNGRGFDCYNLSGGYRLYKAVTGQEQCAIGCGCCG